MARRALVAGATGFIGSRLALALPQKGWEVRCLVRDATGPRATELRRSGLALHEGDVLDPESLKDAGLGVDVAYYLVHSMGRGAAGDFAENERAGARSFAEMARTEGVRNVIYPVMSTDG